MTQSAVAAGPLRRIMSLVYDVLLLLGISFGYGVIVLLLRLMVGADTMSSPTGLEQALILVGACFCYGLFFSWCWLRRGQTLGMKSWRMQLVQADDSPITVKTCIYRCLVSPLLIAAGGIGFWWCWFDRDGDSLQDRLTGTRILLLEKEKKG